LHAYLERHARSLSEAFAERSSLRERVRELIVEMPRAGEPSQTDVARKLGMSERTLHRRLREEGQTFADILDTVRRELALRYLADLDLAVYEIAFLLGYSDPSSFHRAFRRWMGDSPQEVRARLRSGAR
jgi:AraC-like DNA-binding protein